MLSAWIANPLEKISDLLLIRSRSIYVASKQPYICFFRRQETTYCSFMDSTISIPA